MLLSPYTTVLRELPDRDVRLFFLYVIDHDKIIEHEKGRLLFVLLSDFYGIGMSYSDGRNNMLRMKRILHSLIDDLRQRDVEKFTDIYKYMILHTKSQGSLRPLFDPLTPEERRLIRSKLSPELYTWQFREV